MRKFLIYCTLFTFFIYWAITLLFVAPTNPVSDSFFEDKARLRYAIGQNWSLFVPPPMTNNKMYYTFHEKKSGKRYTFEVLANLLKLKSANAPFNATEGVRDYILSSCQNHLTWWVENPQEKTDSLETTYAYQLLKQYSLFVAEQHEIPVEDYWVSFRLVRMEIPDFEQREKLVEEGYVFQEKTLYESEKFSVAP